MYLYEKNQDKIDIYSFEADIEKLKDYRKKILDERKKCDIFYILETTDKNIVQKFMRGDRINVTLLERNNYDSQLVTYPKNYYSLKTNELLHQEIIDNYIDGYYEDKMPTTVFQKEDGDELFFMDYLITKDVSQISLKNEKKIYYRLDDIIKLPSELSILQFLENGKFDKILNSKIDFSEQLKMFDINKIESISEDVIMEMCKYNLINENYKDIAKKINTAQKILKKIDNRR